MTTDFVCIANFPNPSVKRICTSFLKNDFLPKEKCFLNLNGHLTLSNGLAQHQQSPDF